MFIYLTIIYLFTMKLFGVKMKIPRFMRSSRASDARPTAAGHGSDGAIPAGGDFR